MVRRDLKSVVVETSWDTAQDYEVDKGGVGRIEISLEHQVIYIHINGRLKIVPLVRAYTMEVKL